MEILNLQRRVRIDPILAVYSHLDESWQSGYVMDQTQMRGLRVKRQRPGGVITFIYIYMREYEGSVRWELTVGASGGQPQAYTSLCLFKLKCSLFPYIAL